MGIRFGTSATPAANRQLINIGGQDFIPVAGGRYPVGSRKVQNNPVHEVEIPSALLGRGPVPNSEMDSFVAAMGDRTHALVGKEANGRLHILTAPAPEKAAMIPLPQILGNPDLAWGANLVWTDKVRIVPVPSSERLKELSAAYAASNHPAVLVNLFQALGYCAWKSEVTGRHHYVPDEWLWEVAMSSGQGEKNEFATKDGTLSPNLAYYGKNWKDGTAPIGSYPANEWGFVDGTGQVFEMTMSPFDPNSPCYVWRGGFFFFVLEAFPRLARRNVSNDPGNAYGNAGFRVAVAPQDSR